MKIIPRLAPLPDGGSFFCDTYKLPARNASILTEVDNNSRAELANRVGTKQPIGISKQAGESIQIYKLRI
ncbi:MAG: hypothetical protein QG620_653 [Patescibacteria group bacterium]|nr:hypothetical protein [Patescibacteria group bacterium]